MSRDVSADATDSPNSPRSSDSPQSPEYWQILRSALGSQKVILPSAAAAVVRSGTILLVRHAKLETWHLPGGFQDLDESVTQTAARELREETGLSMETGQLVSVLSGADWDIEYPNGDVIQSLEFCFLMKGEFDLHELKADREEVHDLRFFPLSSPPQDIAPCCLQQCRDVLAFGGASVVR